MIFHWSFDRANIDTTEFDRNSSLAAFVNQIESFDLEDSENDIGALS
jgi:hypothetical protein